MQNFAALQDYRSSGVQNHESKDPNSGGNCVFALQMTRLHSVRRESGNCFHTVNAISFARHEAPSPEHSIGLVQAYGAADT
jgi:hypothetical protein